MSHQLLPIALAPSDSGRRTPPFAPRDERRDGAYLSKAGCTFASEGLTPPTGVTATSRSAQVVAKGKVPAPEAVRGPDKITPSLRQKPSCGHLQYRKSILPGCLWRAVAEQRYAEIAGGP
jgi:hypothetical protein